MPVERGTRVEIGLLALLMFSVVALGGTSYWARGILQAGAALLLVSWWLGAGASNAPEEFSREYGLHLGGVQFRRSGLGIPAALFLVVVAFQLIPVPGALREWASPELMRWEVPPQEVLTALESSSQPEIPAWRPLSIDPGATISGLLMYLAYASLFVVTLNLVDSRTRLVRMLQILVAFAFIVALFGLVQHLSGTERIYGLKTLRYGGSPFGPFVNHNSYAGFMELTIPITCALLLRRMLRPPSSTPVSSSVRRGSGTGFTLPVPGYLRGERSGQAILLGLALGVMATSLVLSFSRGGLLSLSLATMVTLLVLAIRGRLGRWELALVAMVLAIGLGLLLWIGPGSIVDHFRVAESGQNEPSLVTRILISKTTVKASLGFPVLGTGLSTFPAAFLHYYPAGDEKVWLQAHNDYAQILLETGIVGSVIAALGLLVLSVQLLGPIAGRQEVGERLIYYALCISILSLMIHSVVDFNLHVPANAALFVVVLAMALAHRSVLRRSPSREA